MLSRVASSLYWLARYLERAEGSARFLEVTHSYAQELRSVSHLAEDRCWTVDELVAAQSRLLAGASSELPALDLPGASVRRGRRLLPRRRR